MKTEQPENNLFTQLNVFENQEINASLDSLYNLLISNFGEIGDKIKVCGSVAKMFDGKLPEDYQPKDIDVVVFDRVFWRFLFANADSICSNVIRMDYRIILTYQNHLIEIWTPMLRNNHQGIYKDKIHYCYADKN